jgi:hypothetical protein
MSPYEQGRYDCLIYNRKCENPFKINTKKYHEWKRGYNDMNETPSDIDYDIEEDYQRFDESMY